MSVRLDTMGHLTADTEDELHAFAQRIGLRREWYQDGEAHTFWHYDITTYSKRRRAIRAGAKPMSPPDALRLHPVWKERHLDDFQPSRQP